MVEGLRFNSTWHYDGPQGAFRCNCGGVVGLNSHSHRGFSPVSSALAKILNRFNGFPPATTICPAKPLKRFMKIFDRFFTRLKPRCE